MSDRTGEIGVRMALGAQRGRIVRLIFGETARLVAVGMAAGIGIALAGARAVEKMLYGMKPAECVLDWERSDHTVWRGADRGLVPAQRASRVEPMVALRRE